MNYKCTHLIEIYLDTNYTHIYCTICNIHIRIYESPPVLQTKLILTRLYVE